MSVPGVLWVGPVTDISGYGHASRACLAALHAAKVPVRAVPWSWDPHTAPYGKHGELVEELLQADVTPEVLVMHTIPDFWREIQARYPGLRTIGMTIWETSALHPGWVQAIEEARLTSLWVPNNFNKAVFQKAMPTLPIDIVPHVVDVADFDAHTTPLQLRRLQDDRFVFYTVSQLSRRKNFEGLFAAYCHAFTAADPVTLIVKTYRTGTSNAEQEETLNLISDAIAATNMTSRPAILPITEHLSFPQMVGLHRRGDCYVSAHLGEGWGLGISDAFACGKTGVVTGWSGNMAFCNHENSYPVGYQLTPVRDMLDTPWYDARQCWAEPNLVAFASTLRHVYENPQELRSKGRRAKATVRQFSPSKIGQVMRQLLSEVVR